MHCLRGDKHIQPRSPGRDSRDDAALLPGAFLCAWACIALLALVQIEHAYYAIVYFEGGT
ncbi:MAG TPA: hypothetical protein VIZ30_09445 [Pseudomonadales bacterium]